MIFKVNSWFSYKKFNISSYNRLKSIILLKFLLFWNFFFKSPQKTFKNPLEKTLWNFPNKTPLKYSTKKKFRKIIIFVIFLKSYKFYDERPENAPKKEVESSDDDDEEDDDEAQIDISIEQLLFDVQVLDSAVNFDF